jgi:hypothetical protein
LPLTKRADIARRFGIAKVRATHVSNNQVIDDGYNIKDIENATSVEQLQVKLNTNESDHDALWAMMISDEPTEVPAPVVEAAPVVPEVVTKKVAVKRAPRAKKNVK